MDYYKEHEKEAIEIPISEIKLTEYIHKTGFYIGGKQHKSRKDCIVLVRTRIDGTYSLVSGWDDFMIAKQRGYYSIQAIVTNPHKGDFLRLYSTVYLPLEKLIVPEFMACTKPAHWKIKRVRDRLGNKMQLDKPITIDRDNVIRDGYTRYLIAKEQGIRFVPVRYVQYKKYSQHDR